MNPGDFNKRIAFVKEIATSDDEGYSTTKKEVVKKAWAMAKTIQGYKGLEFTQANGIQNIRQTRFVIRYTKGIDESMLIDFDGRIFHIEAILQDDEQKKTLTVIAKERL